MTHGRVTGHHKKSYKNLRRKVKHSLCPGSAQKCAYKARSERIAPDKDGIVRVRRKTGDGKRRKRFFITHDRLNPKGRDRLIPVGGTDIHNLSGTKVEDLFDEHVTQLTSPTPPCPSPTFQDFVSKRLRDEALQKLREEESAPPPVVLTRTAPSLLPPLPSVSVDTAVVTKSPDKRPRVESAVDKAARETEEFLAQLEAEMLEQSKETDTGAGVAYSPGHVPLSDLEEDSGYESAESETGRATKKRRKVLMEEDPVVPAPVLIASSGVGNGSTSVFE